MSHLSSTGAPLLVLAATAEQAKGLREALLAAGEHDVLAAPCAALVQCVETRAPRQVLCALPGGIEPLLRELAAWQGVPPCPVTWVGAVPDAAALVAAGIASHCATLDGAAAALAEARARFERERRLREELMLSRAQLDDRKWVDRAKGVLMAARSMPEDEAYKLLRGAAMQANLKLVQVSRAVVDAARWAEAINRAGQLRMLSQRLVASAGQRLLQVPGAQARKSQAERRAQANIDHLASLGLAGDGAAALARVNEAWSALAAALGNRGGSAALAQADERATALLEAADALVSALEVAGAARALAIVNECGRQRMRTQRLVKDAVLAALLPPGGSAERLRDGITEFEQALAMIEAAPLSSPEIKSALAASREGWLTLLRALRSADHTLLAHAADALLEHLDRLTDSCEHSLQVLMA